MMNPLPETPAHRLPTFLRALRPQQWPKNFLVFVPIVTAHQVMRPAVLAAGTLAFLTFCLVASATYLANDLCDLKADRRHRRKKMRPLAAGDIRPQAGVVLAILLGVAGSVLALFGSVNFLLLIVLYVVLSLAYSFRLKQVVWLDVMALGFLYTMRILAGGAITGIPISHWLLSFSLFFFLSLALVKRYAEMRLENEPASTRLAGRGYVVGDQRRVALFGIASGCVSLLVLILYVRSDEVAVLYRHPLILALIVPLFLYWMVRVWLLAHRGRIKEDPVVFALTDGASYLAGVLCSLVILAAIFL